MTFKIIADGEKFKIKELDAEGNSVRLLEETFDTHEEATMHIKNMEEGAQTGVATSATEGVNVANPEESTDTTGNTEGGSMPEAGSATE